jgi:DNA-binding response OmpR family regulator
MANAPDSIIQTKRILLLEDDKLLTTMIKGFLESHSYEVVAVANGAEGVRTLMKEDFDIIICDMIMPKLPGDLFYFAVKKTKPHLCRRFIFITGYTDNSRINDFIKEVNGTMLTKPFPMNKLLEAAIVVQNLGYSISMRS